MSRIRLPLLLCLLISTGCVYFNTYYNAQKYYRQAEKARKRQEEEAFARGLGEVNQNRNSQANQLYDKAARGASKVLEKYKESELVDDAMLLMGKAFYWQGDYLSAIRTFRDLETNFPQSEFYDRARYWRALSHEAQLMNDLARPIYRSLFTAGDKDLGPRAGLRLGEMAFAEEDLAVAIQEFQATLDAFPDTELRAELWLRLGEAVFAQEDSSRYDQALAAFDGVLEENPTPEMEYHARLNRGRLLYERGEAEAALKTYERLLSESKFRPFEGQTRILIGQYYQERHMLDQALEEYEQVRDDFPQTPSSAMALYRTGLLYLRDYGEGERAREYLQEVGREKAGSEAARLAQEMLGYLALLQQHRQRILQADSLAVAQAAPVDSAAVADSLTVAPVARTPEVRDDLLAVAELYRDPERLAVPDSAIYFYREILTRFPEFDQAARILYSIAWIYAEMVDDQAAARPYMERLITEFPASKHANAARRYLGEEIEVTDEERAAAEFQRIEKLRLEEPGALDVYVPLLDSLSSAYAGTEVAARAAYLAAFAFENAGNDSSEAARRYELVRERFPNSPYARLVAKRDSVHSNGLIAKMARSLKAVGGRLRPGERIEVLAIEPDSLDSVALARKYYGFALRAQRRGDLKQAREFYELSLDERLNQPEALYQLGNVVMEQGFPREAIELYREALSFRRSMLGPQYELMAAFTVDGQADSASAYLRQIALADRRNPQVEYLLQEYPDLAERGNDVELDIDELEKLDLEPVDRDLSLSFNNVLSELPLVREMGAAAYPEGATADSAEVVLDLLLDTRGEVEQVEVFSGPEEFRDAAIAAARNYRCYPAVGRDGVEKKVWVELVLPFKRSGGEIGSVTEAASDTVSALTVETP